ncbi:hypothetical protein D9613_006549 [Agrocybe pediades]|uniref:Uncharacterized protein n=1 Tax=Agrocybe pediades TaxID=84607 RepID=A0A8H4QHN3_9AGAR|nr:hypothetical protein D9613_006549 [Agrocybe pediades]
MSMRDRKEIHSVMLDLPLFVDNDTRTEATRIHLEYAAASAPAPSAQVEKPSVNKAAPADDAMKQIAALTKRMNNLEKRADASDKENGELKKTVQGLTLRNRADKETSETKELVEELIKNSVGELEAENVELKKRLLDFEKETNRMKRALQGAHKAFEDLASTPANSS